MDKPAATQAAAGISNTPADNSRFADLGCRDAHCDGTLDFFDIDPFLLALFDPDEYELAFPNCDINNADINTDNSIDFFDIDPFLVVLFE